MTAQRLIIGVGLLTGIIAIFVSILYPERVWVVALFSFFSLSFLIWYFKKNIYLLKVYSRRRSVHLKLNLAITIALLFFIIVILNLIVRQFYFRMDTTSTRRYSLSPQSITILKKVDRPISLIYFGSRNTRGFSLKRHLLDAYRYENRNIIYELHDLDSVPLLASRYGVREYDTVVVKDKERFFKEKGGTEQTITNLILQAIRKKKPNIKFLQGHDEKTLSETDRSGYGRLSKLLLQSGYDVEEINLTETGKVPSDTDLLVIASPEREPRDNEYQMLFDFMDSGGKFLLLLDSPQQLRPFLSYIYLRVSEYPVYDTQHVAGIGPSAPLVKKYYDNPVTRDFGLATFFPGVYEVQFIGSLERYDFRNVVRASEHAWYEKNGDGIKQKEEEEGLQRLGAILIPKEELYRVAIFGDSDFISNAYIGVGGNGELLMRTINWLLSEGSLASIASNPGEVIPIFMTQRQAETVRLISATIPILIFLAGIIVWFKRRRL